MNRDVFYCRHVLDCIARIVEYTQAGEAAFLGDGKTQDAVVRNLQVMAESTQRISEPLKNAHPEIEWRAIAGFRNVLVHNYLGLDTVEDWRIVERDLPPLRDQITAVLSRLDAPSD